TIPRVNPLALVQVQAALTWMDRLARRVPAHAPWSAAHADALDGQTVESWTRARFPSRLVRDLLRPAVRTVFGADPGEVSFLHFLTYASSAGGVLPLIE